MQIPTVSRPSRSLGGSLLAAGCLTILLTGCQSKDAAQVELRGPAKVRIGYLGLTCEAAMFVAKEKGFFKEEGLDVEFVKTDWDGLRDGLGLGRFDANYTLIMYLLKPIEQGLDVKITGGIHTGCLRLQVGAKSDIKTVADLKGKKIGVPTHIGSPPFLFTSRVLAAARHGPARRTSSGWRSRRTCWGWRWTTGRSTPCATPSRSASILLAQEKVRTIADQAADAPVQRRVLLRGRSSAASLARENPAAAAKVTRALLKGGEVGRREPDGRGQAVGREEVHRRLGGDQRPGDLEAEVHARRVAMPGEHRAWRRRR